MATTVETRRGTQHVQWLHDLEQAFQQAKQQNKYVLLDFFSPT